MSPAPRNGTRFGAVLPVAGLVLAVASCTPIGLPEGPGPVRVAGPQPRPEVARAPVTRSGAAISLPRNLPPRTRFDAILDSPAAADTAFQRQIAFWVDFWTGDQEDLFARYLERMGEYGPMVDREIARRGLPESLRFLPIVESGYFPRAVSRAGATGLWQLMAPTAGDLGLRVNSIVDDRRDPYVSTAAALDYLTRLNDQFDSWFLALAAYNVGQGRVRQLLNQAGREGGDDAFHAIRNLLPAETREFVPRLFAAALIAGNPEAFGYPPVVWNPPVFDEVVVPDATSVDVIARTAGVTEEEIEELNPQFLRGFTPAGERRVVRVPVGRGGPFTEAYALLPANERLSFLEHVVAPNETFSHIAVRYSVSLNELMAMNSQVDPKRLRVGMRVVVPVGGRPSSATSTPAVTQVAARDPDAGPRLHTVTAGESLWTIARRYGVSTGALAAANQRVENTVIRPGERLRIP